MKIKNLFSAVLFAFTLFISGNVMAVANPGEEVPKEVRAQEITNRIMEIKKLAKETELTPVQKQELRKEVKHLRKEAQSRGIYLSIGAIVIIILLLILILK